MGIQCTVCTVLLLAVGNTMAPSHAEDLQLEQLEQQGHFSLDPPVHLREANMMILYCMVSRIWILLLVLGE